MGTIKHTVFAIIGCGTKDIKFRISHKGYDNVLWHSTMYLHEIYSELRGRYDDGDEDDNKTNMQNEYTTDKTRSCKHIRITKGSLTPIKRIIRTSYELMNLQQRCAKCIDFFAPLYYFLFVVYY